jgi:hypothetical protein
MSYDVQPSLLAVVPTRDGYANPSRRMPDKHTRLLHGKTLDEWKMLQLWSSKYLGKALFVCETEAHKERLQPLADKYDVELFVRPAELLHPINDSGSYVTWAGLQHALKTRYYTFLMMPFVVAPCYPPGLIDWLVDEYLRIMPGIDIPQGAGAILGGYPTDVTGYSMWVEEDKGFYRRIAPNPLEPLRRYMMLNSQIALWSTRMYEGMMYKWFARGDKLCGEYQPKIVEIEPWMDIHIDTESDWEAAEYWFGKKILSKGENCYVEYRNTWKTT